MVGGLAKAAATRRAAVSVVAARSFSASSVATGKLCRTGPITAVGLPVAAFLRTLLTKVPGVTPSMTFGGIDIFGRRVCAMAAASVFVFAGAKAR